MCDIEEQARKRKRHKPDVTRLGDGKHKPKVSLFHYCCILPFLGVYLQPGVIHVSLVEKVGHPQALIGTMIGNQHGVSFSQEVGLSVGSEEDEEDGLALEGSQVRKETTTPHVHMQPLDSPP